MSSRRLFALLVAVARATDLVEGGGTCSAKGAVRPKSVSLLQAVTQAGAQDLAADDSLPPPHGSATLAESAPAVEPAAGAARAAKTAAVASQDTWVQLLEARSNSTGGAESFSRLLKAGKALSAGGAALRTRGAVEATFIIIFVVVGFAVCLLWHNNWSVQGAVDESREAAGKAAHVAKKGTHGAAVVIEKLTRDKREAGNPSAASSSQANGGQDKTVKTETSPLGRMGGAAGAGGKKEPPKQPLGFTERNRILREEESAPLRSEPGEATECC